jgi:hypothetical protein
VETYQAKKNWDSTEGLDWKHVKTRWRKANSVEQMLSICLAGLPIASSPPRLWRFQARSNGRTQQLGASDLSTALAPELGCAIGKIKIFDLIPAAIPTWNAEACICCICLWRQVRSPNPSTSQVYVDRSRLGHKFWVCKNSNLSLFTWHGTFGANLLITCWHRILQSYWTLTSSIWERS